jgi:elongation factor 1-alpha
MEQNIFNFDDKLDRENEYGNIEYKRELINLDEEKLNKRITQMKYRVYEGSGEAFYLIGVSDDGTILGLNETEYNESISNLEKISKRIDCYIIKISEYIKNNNFVGEFLIRENDNLTTINIKVGVAGNVDSGKSTTVGTLTKGILDDGRGKARLHVFNYKHEVSSGRTSSIGHQIMGFDKEGSVVNIKLDKNNAWNDISCRSSKLISFYDLAGHEKYLRTTIHGLSSLYPDYCLIMVGANMGINHMTREHIGLCINLKIPFIILVTKIDIVPTNILEENMIRINNMCKNRIRKIPYHIKNISDILNVIKNIKSDSIVPIIQISNVTNFNLDLVKTLLNLLPVRNTFSQNMDKPVELIIDNTYSVPGHTTIVSGMLKSGTVKVNDNLVIGPFPDSSYRSVKVRSIHLNFKDLKEALSGSYICVSLKNIIRREIKKGMIIVSDDPNLKVAVKQFMAQVHILHSPTTIKEGYKPFVHIEHVRQVVKMLEINKEICTTNINNEDTMLNDKLLRCGDKALVKLEFGTKPEFIKIGMRMIFREGKVKAIGKIVEILN